MRDEDDARRAVPAGKLTQDLEARLREISARGEMRSLEVPAGINLISNDYLDLSTHPALREALVEGIARHERVASGGSRLLAGNAREWEELEEEFAAFAGTDAALYFSSGFAANAGLLGAIAGRGDIVFSDALNHASLIDGIRLSGAEKVIYPHCDLSALESALRERVNEPGNRIIVTESVFSMDGDLAPLAGIVELAQTYGAEVIVDEAHATGVFGPEGRGRIAEFGLTDAVFATIHMCGKALASNGAFVCGSATLKNFLINRARTFVFSTALPRYFAAQICAALQLARGANAERARLKEISSRLRAQLRVSGWDTGASASQIVPVLLRENDIVTHVATELTEEGFAVRAIRAPTVPASSARLRLSLTCALRDEELAQLSRAMQRIAVSEQRVAAARA